MLLDSLRLFLAVAKHQNITQAAKECNLSQPAASIKLGKLEKQYGVVLFNRSKKRFELTVAGSYFLEAAKRILAIENRFVEDIGRTHKNYKSILKFGASTGPGNYILPKLISDFHKKNPHVYLEMVVGNTRDILERVKNRYLHFAFVGSKGEQRLLYQTLVWDRILLCSSVTQKWPDHISLRELPRYDLFFEQKGSSSRQVLETWLEKNGISLFSLKCIGEIGLPDALKKVIQLGQGIAFLPETLIKNELEKGVLKEIGITDTPPLKRPLYLAIPRDSKLNEIAEDFINNYLKKL